MLFVFVDESFCSENKGKDPSGYYSIAMVVINSHKYNALKRDYLEILDSYKWPHSLDTEFKASDIFSSKKCPSNICVEQKIDMVEKFIDQMTSEKNRNMKIYFFYKKINNESLGIETYIENVPKLLKKAISGCKTSGKNADAKNGCAIFVDDFESAERDKQKLRKNIASTLQKAGLVFFEDIFRTKSTIYTLGIMYADLAAYILFKSKDLVSIHPKREPVIKNLGSKLEKLVVAEYKNKI